MIKFHSDSADMILSPQQGVGVQKNLEAEMAVRQATVAFKSKCYIVSGDLNVSWCLMLHLSIVTKEEAFMRIKRCPWHLQCRNRGNVLKATTVIENNICLLHNA